MVAVPAMSSSDKIIEMLTRSKKFFSPALGKQVDAFLSPENIAIVSATFLLWGISHLFGVGEVIDVALLIVGAAALGASAGDAITQLVDSSVICLDAKSEADLDRSAELFARAVTTLGVDIVMALLLRRSAKGLQASKGGGVANPSWLKVAKPVSPGLPNVGKDPFAGSLWSRFPKPRAVPSSQIGGMRGMATYFGEILYTVQATPELTAETISHEAVHQALTPRLGFLRTFRVQLRAAGYGRSVLLQYLEEALAQGYAEMLKNPLTGIFKGVAFPITHGYVTISALGGEVGAVGTIMLGAQRFSVMLDPTGPTWAKDLATYLGQALDPDTPVITLKTGIDQIYGWWWFNMNGGQWSYYFTRDKKVRWYDIYNHRSGNGTWSPKADAIDVLWTSGTRETWPLDLVTSGKKGTSVSGGKTSEFTATRVWDSQMAQFTGRWKMLCDKWIWNIEFSEDGGARWSDFYNPAENGRGTFHLLPNGLYIMWQSGSHDEWSLEKGGGAASGKNTVGGKPYTFSATKTL